MTSNGEETKTYRKLCINDQLDAQIFLYLYNIPLHVLSNNAHLLEVTLLYTCSIWYHHSLGAVVVAIWPPWLLLQSD